MKNLRQYFKIMMCTCLERFSIDLKKLVHTTCSLFVSSANARKDKNSVILMAFSKTVCLCSYKVLQTVVVRS